MKRLIPVLAFAVVLSVLAGPQVSSVAVVPGDNRSAVVSYVVSGAPAIVTVAVKAGAEQVTGESLGTFEGDINKRVEEDGTYTFTWRGATFAADPATVEVTAWGIDTPPDYMAVKLARGAVRNRVSYYASTNDLPGGLFGNSAWRTSEILMRRIPAKGDVWQMGTDPGESGYTGGGTIDGMSGNTVREMRHAVTNKTDWWMGVFEVTISQWRSISDSVNGYFNSFAGSALRPMDGATYNHIRSNVNNTSEPTTLYPNDPGANSYLGLLRARTGIAFDLPSEAQWEYSCRGRVYAKNTFNNGAAYYKVPGRVYNNGGKVMKEGDAPNTPSQIPPYSCNPSNGTAIVGSYAPNCWGLYDMHGNVHEWCLDWHEPAISNFCGAVNVDLEHPENTLSGVAGTKRQMRGGCAFWGADCTRAGFRSNSYAPNSIAVGYGARLWLAIGPATDAAKVGTNSVSSAAFAVNRPAEAGNQALMFMRDSPVISSTSPVDGRYVMPTFVSDAHQISRRPCGCLLIFR